MDISAEIAAIQAASQGSELRQPLVGALNKLNSGALPAVTASDAGKILKVGANGWEVGEKSGYMPVPTATKQITENGTHDVTNYSQANVNVSSGASGNTKMYQLEYIESPSIGDDTPKSGSASVEGYLLTGFHPSNNSKIEMDVVNANSYSQFFGVWDNAWNYGSYCFVNDGANMFISNYNTTYTGRTSIDSLEHKIIMDCNVAKIDNETVYTFPQATFSITRELSLFAENRAGTPHGPASGRSFRMKECKIYENNIIQMDIVPVIIKYYNDTLITCCFDKINNKLIEFKGNGVFTAGPILQEL